MFGKVRETLANLTKRLGETLAKKELSEEEFEEIFEEFQLSLLEGDVAYEAVELLKEAIKSRLVGIKVPRLGDARRVVVSKIREALYEILAKGVFKGNLEDLVAGSPKPYVIMFMGVNGVGKTTTIAKIAFRLRERGLKSVIVAADTFRAGAQEQLAIHARRLSLPFIKGKYGSDPAAVAKDGVIYATKHGLDAVLVDTAGRMHTDYDLMEELRKIARVIKPNMRILVLDSLTGNDAIQQARWFDEAVGVDCVVLTKVDADAKGGSALSVILGINKPIIYLGVGQEYKDLRPFDPTEILNKLIEQ